MLVYMVLDLLHCIEDILLTRFDFELCASTIFAEMIKRYYRNQAGFKDEFSKSKYLG